MRKTVERTVVFVLVASFVLAGCSDRSPVAPDGGTTASFFARPPAQGFGVLRRNVPLSIDLTVGKVVGPEGGQLEIAEAGISFVIPPNALTEATTITMTALAGDAMAVEFAPHGLEFEIPARLQVRPHGTPAEETLVDMVDGEPLSAFLGVYFDGDPEFGVEPMENIATHFLGGMIVFLVGHFSGYVVATG